jgi:3-hydroxyisobutyrate dehydrogenase
MPTIGFVGLGKMGAPMAANLVKAGYTVRGYDVNAQLCAEAAGRGVTPAKSGREAVKDADVVITMLPSGRHVLSVMEDLLPHIKPAALFIDCSTIDVGSARQMHELAESAGISSLDAPVSGGTRGAEDATLTLICGGSEQAFAAAQPYLAAMGSKSVHCGEAGSGQIAKICNNMVLGAIMGATAEAFVIAKRLGLSQQVLFDVMSVSSGSSRVLTGSCPVPGILPTSASTNGFKPGFTTALMLKDMRLAQDAAKMAGVAAPVVAQAAEAYAAAERAGFGQEDFSAVIKALDTQHDDHEAAVKT